MSLLLQGMQSAGAMAGQAELYRHHPMIMVVATVGISCVVVILVSLVRWLMSAGAWKYHPRGAVGFLIDEMARWGAILVPYLVLALIFRFYVYDLHPELNTPNVWAIFVACALVFRIVLRRLPIIKAMARHIDAAKAAQRAARG